MHHKGFWFGLIASVVLGLGFSDTALAQLTSNPTSLTYNLSSGTSQQQTLQVSTTNSTTVTPSTNAAWLNVAPSITNVLVGTPVTFTVTANTQGLIDGTYVGQVSFNVSGSPVLQIPVTLNVGGNSAGTLTAVPSNLTFSAQAASLNLPAAQTVVINNSAATAATFTATSNATWLTLESSGGTTGTASATLTVHANQSGLAASATPYSGQINIASSSGIFSIPVTFNVSSAPTLTVTPPGPLNFFYQTSQSFPAPQTIVLGSSGATIPFTVGTSTSNNGNWLVVSPQGGGATPATITVSINPQNLTQGTYTGSVNINAPGTSQPNTAVQVSLVVSNNALLVVAPATLTFTSPSSGNAPASQTLQVTSSGTPLTFTAAASSGTAPTTWLSVTPGSGTTGTASGTLTVSVNQQGLVGGTYNGTITITSTGAGNSPQTIPVTLTVSNTIQITAAPPALTFNYQIGQAPPGSQTVALTSTGQALSYTVASTTTTCGGNWLNALSQNSQTPGSVIVGISTTGLAAGPACTGTVTITPTAAGTNPVTIPVTLNVSATPLLNVSPTYVAVTLPPGAPSQPAQTIAVTSTDPATSLAFSASASSTGGQWLFVGPGATTPFNLQYQISPGNLASGTYTGTITITPTGGGVPQTVTIALTIQSQASLTASPTSLAFGETVGGGVPAAQMIHLTSTQGALSYTVSFTTQQGGPWLTVTPLSGGTAGDLTVSVDGRSLGQGVYNGTITIVAPGANNTPVTIPVTLTVAQPQTLTVTPPSLTFTNPVAAAGNPANQTLTITSSGGPASFTVASAVQTPAGGAWLTATPPSGTTALNNAAYTAAVTVAVNPVNLPVGTYTGTVTISSPTAVQPIVVTVTLTVTPTQPVVSSVWNAADNQPGAIAPGEILAIKGTLLGPATPVNYTVNPQGGLDSTLGGVQVLFDDIPGTPYYVSASQINVIAPYGIAGRTQTAVTVVYQNQRSASQTYTVASANPGIFTLNTTGSGPGAIVNQDGSINGPPGLTTAYPTIGAPRGTVVLVYATGGGQTNPPGTTGCVTPLTLPLRFNSLPVTATVGGVPAEVQFAGGAPGLVCGALQLNVKIPDAAPLGNNTVVFTVGTGSSAVTSPATVTLTVR